MYKIKVTEKAQNTLWIVLEGKLSNEVLLENDLKILHELYEDEISEINFDVENLEMINESCYNILMKLENRYKINLINCSLFIAEEIEGIKQNLKQENN